MSKPELTSALAHLAKHPYETDADYATGRRRLDLVDVADYEKIIMANFDHFQPVFGQKASLTKHMEAFRDFRNAAAHNHKLNEVQRKLPTRPLYGCSRLSTASISG